MQRMDLVTVEPTPRGCVCLKRGEYCILNKKYKREEYEQLVPRIIQHMRGTGEWGEFFPPEVAPFAYNESSGPEYFPLSADDARRLGFEWREEAANRKQVEAVELPDGLDQTSDSVTEQLLSCKESMAPYKVILPELKLYCRIGVALPRLAPESRRKVRLGLRNGAQLRECHCCACKRAVPSSYDPELGYRLLCEECYLKILY